MPTAESAPPPKTGPLRQRVKRRGIGSTLHDHALERLHALGAAEARLWTLEENHDARRFYERRGWTLNGETRTVEFPPYPLDVGYSRSIP